jgi:ribonuclease-3
MKVSLDKLCEKLGYKFQDITFLEMALTHRSRALINNERLEFLGDSVLNFCITGKLFSEHPKLTEGGLSRLRANLVNGEVLAAMAKELTINQYLRLGAGEMKSGGLHRKSILANVFEAVVGAIYLDGEISAAQPCILRWFTTRLENITARGVTKDPKTQLQEYLQSQKFSLPKYAVLKIEGREHNQVFKVECRVSGMTQTAIGEGSSRRRAEQHAAEQFLLISNSAKNL